MLDFNIEKSYGEKVICGVDEVGRGPLAGPVVAAAVIVSDFDIEGINDSKKISSKKREILSEKICAKYLYAIGEASVEEIEEYNILNATKLAISRAVVSLDSKPEIILVDGNMKFSDEKYISIVKGDSKSYSVACASIVAKVYRDKLMAGLAAEFPYYGWEKNSGYGTKNHIESIISHGVTQHHRKSFLSNIL